MIDNTTNHAKPYWEYIINPETHELPLPPSPRYERATKLACIFILHEGVTAFPIDPFSFFKKYNIKLCKYSRIAQKRHLRDVSEIIQETGSKDGLTVYRNGRIAVSYNDWASNQGRVFFTLFHEIGHIVLGHPFDFACTQLSRGGDDEVEILEKEADCFSRNVLAPVVLVESLRNRRAINSLDMFHMTDTAWNTRLDLLARDKRNTHPTLALMMRKRLNEFMYGSTCIRCGAGFVRNKESQYCPICGSRRIKWRLGNMKYNDGYEVDEQGRARQCPQCENEENLDDGEYCMICGQILINRCSDYECGRIAQGNARYCTQCGAKTTFYETGRLDDWATAKKKLEAPTLATSDDDLPF